VIYDCVAQTITCNEISQPLPPSNGVVHLQMLVDRGLIEIFGSDGLLYMPMRVSPAPGLLAVNLTATGMGATLNSLTMHHLGSAWASLAAAPPMVVTSPAAATVCQGNPAVFSVIAGGVGPLSYQWRANGQPVAGATNRNLTIFPALASAHYDVVVSNAGGAVTSSVAPLMVQPAYSVAYWRMESQISAPNNAGVPAFVGVADAATNLGQGIYTTGSLPPATDDLITFNGLSGGPVVFNTNVAPATMFVNAHSAGNFSYDAAAITNVDGALFFPQDQYGDEMDFTGPFSIELFFQTDGNRANAGPMQLVAQGSDTGQTFRYGIAVNEAGQGTVRFTVVNSGLSQTETLDLAGTNYADGQWHYLLAVCDTMSGPNGQLRLTIVNPDGSEADATNNLPPGFLPLPAVDNGNLFLGRYTYPVSEAPRTFLGCLDEVQITAGLVPDTARVGKIPSIDNHPRINGISPGTGANSAGLGLHWTGAVMNDFLVQWVPQLGDAWQTIATLPRASPSGSFNDTNLVRLTNAAGFYRILSQ